MTIHLNIDDDLEAAIKRIATLTKLNQVETMRQALRLGLPVLADKWPKPYCQPDVRRAAAAKFPRKDGAK